MNQFTGKGGPRTAEGKARALANLRPSWRPGQSGNPKGRPRATMTVAEWINQMGSWPLWRVKQARDDTQGSVAKRAAAKAWLDACGTDGVPDVGRLARRLDGLSAKLQPRAAKS